MASFFEPWQDDKHLHSIVVALLFLGMFTGLMVWNIQPAERANLIEVFIFLGILSLIGYVFDYLAKDEGPIQALGLGTPQRAGIAVATGIALALGLHYARIGLGIYSIGIPTPALNWLMTVIGAGILEPLAFRGLIQPTATKAIKNLLGIDISIAWFAALLFVQTPLFIGYHLLFKTGTELVGLFAFSVVSTIMAYFFRSTAFELGFHVTSNHFAWEKLFGSALQLIGLR